MRCFALFAFGLGCFASLLAAGPAHAQATRTWVSGVGDDVNPCSRTAPCKTFAGAISKTAAAGEIDCLDPGGFGTVTITKSLTISCRVQDGGILVGIGTTGVIINAGVNDTVILKGVDIQGAGAGLTGVRVVQAQHVVVQDSNISGVTGIGIDFAPIVASKLVLKNVTITNALGGGVRIRPTAAVTVLAAIENVTVSKGPFGIQLDSGGNAAAINANIRYSTLSGNTGTGIQLLAPTNPVAALVTDSAMSFNNTAGVSTSGNSFLRLGRSDITGNSTGVSGTVSSFGTNQLIGNGTDGTLTLLPAPALK